MDTAVAYQRILNAFLQFVVNLTASTCRLEKPGPRLARHASHGIGMCQPSGLVRPFRVNRLHQLLQRTKKGVFVSAAEIQVLAQRNVGQILIV
jgi:hypothetical protein